MFVTTAGVGGYAALTDAGNSAVVFAYTTTTCRTTRPSGDVKYLRAASVGTHPTLGAEPDRCAWLHDRGAPVPELVDYRSDGHVEWRMTALPGVDAIAPEHLADPQRTVPFIAEGLRAFHGIDPTGCPFDYRLPTAIAHAAGRVAAGTVRPEDFHDVDRHLEPCGGVDTGAPAAVDEDHCVVCHGDY